MNKFLSMNKKIITMLIIIVALISFSIIAFCEENNQENEKSLMEQSTELHDKITDTNTKLEYVESELTSSLKQVQELDDTIREYQSKSDELNSQIQQMQQDLEKRQQQIDEVQEKYNKKQSVLKKRTVALYESGETSYIDVLLKSNSILDFLSNYYMLEQLIEFDNNLLEELSNEQEQLEQEKTKQENEQKELKTAQINMTKMQILVQNNKVVQQNYISKLSQEEQELQKQIEQYKNEQDEIDKKIRETIEWSGNLQITNMGGQMIWPVGVAGTYITSSFGYRLHPIQGIYKYHSGIDIGNAGYGAPVLAAADGVVIYAGVMSGYGNCVMINHGDGIVTLYGHGQTILTELGKEVKKGDVIMAVGSTGNSTGPHLHFEVRLNGKAVAPLPYIEGTVSQIKDEYSNDYD